MTVPPIALLDAACRAAGLPYTGLSMGDSVNRATWRIDYASGATPQQRAQGDQLLATIDLSDPALIATVTDTLATSGYDGDAILRAAAQALWECIPAPTMNKAQLRARAIAILKTL
jgi:hypothetical protein